MVVSAPWPPRPTKSEIMDEFLRIKRVSVIEATGLGIPDHGYFLNPIELLVDFEWALRYSGFAVSMLGLTQKQYQNIVWPIRRSECLFLLAGIRQGDGGIHECLQIFEHLYLCGKTFDDIGISAADAKKYRFDCLNCIFRMVCWTWLET